MAPPRYAPPRRAALAATRLGALGAAALALGCGGRTLAEPGPVHEGKGQYELWIEGVSDDCTPPLVTGTVGPVLVWVATGRGEDGTERGANVPIFDVTLAPISAASRADVSLDDPIEYEVPASSGCPGARLRTRMTPRFANGERIDLEIERILTDAGDCDDPLAPQGACTSRRIFHFRWLRACRGEGGTSDC